MKSSSSASSSWFTKNVRWAYMNSPLNGSFLTGYVWPHISRYWGWNPLGRCLAITAKNGWGFESEVKAASAVAMKDPRGMSYFWVSPMAPALVITKESEIRQVLQFNSDNHERGTILQTLERIYPHNIFASKRDHQWHERRSDLQARLFTDRALRNMLNTMQTVMDESLSHLEKENKVELQHLFTQLAMTTLERTQFGTKSDAKATEKLSQNYEEAFQQVLNYRNVPKMWAHDFAKKIGLVNLIKMFKDPTLDIDKAKNHLYISLKEHLFTPENEKIIRSDPDGLLMKIAKAAQPDAKPEELKLDVERVILEAAFLFLAGHETTSRLLQFAVMLLAEHPDVLAKMRKEVDDGTSREYFKAVLNETLRLYPSVPYFGRAVTKSFVIGNIPLTKDIKVKSQYDALMAKRDVTEDVKLMPGQAILISPDVTHHDEKNFKDPMKFFPERFLVNNKPGFFFPFGLGDRQCPGQRFSMQEATLALEKIIMNYDFVITDKNIKHPYETHILGTMHAKDKVYMQFKKRQLEAKTVLSSKLSS